MTTISELAVDIASYPSDNMDITVEDLTEVGNPDGQDVNVGEEWTFRLKVANDGRLDAKKVTIEVTGVNETGLSLRSGTDNWSDTIMVGPFTVDSRSATKTPALYFKAPDRAGPMTLFTARIASCNLSLSPVLHELDSSVHNPLVSFSTDVVGD